MISLRGRLFRFMLKHHRLKKRIIDWNSVDAIIRFRQECEEGVRRFGKLPPGIEILPVAVGDLPAEWVLPSPSAKDKVIFYIHGGGYVSGSCSDHRVHVAKFVKESSTAALLFEYRLAPEHPYPAAIDDSVAAYRWLLAQGTSHSNIVFVGDSAGGGLCLATLLALRDQDVPLPAAVVALSPWTDLKCTGETYRTNAKTCLSPNGTWAAFSKHYAGENDPSLPLISPLYGDLHGLPPMLIYAGGEEILLDDSKRFAEKAKAAGVDVTLKVGEGMFHCYPVCASLFPEATQAMNEISTFIKTHTGR